MCRSRLSVPRAAAVCRSTLPSCAAEASGWSEPNGGGDGDWRLMHEAYIVKPPHGGSHYLWHRDCDRHLWCAEGVDNTAALDQPPGLAHVARDGVPPEGESAELYAAELYARPPLRAAVPYLTVWTALSCTSRQNGTLVLLPAQTASHAADSGGGAARRRGAAWDGLREVDGSPLHTSTRTTGHAAQRVRRHTVWRSSCSRATRASSRATSSTPLAQTAPAGQGRSTAWRVETTPAIHSTSFAFLFPDGPPL